MKRKVLFLIESFIVGGAERVLLNLVNAMDKERFDVTVLAVFKQSVYEGYNCQFSDALDPAVHYRYLVDNSSKWKYRLFNIAFNRLPKKWIHRWMIGTGYDTEVAFYEGLPTSFLAHSSNKKSKKIAWLHYGNGFAGLNDAQKAQYQKLYGDYGEIIGVSKGICDNFKVRVGGSTLPHVLYNIIDDFRIRKKAVAREIVRNPLIPVFVAVGRLTSVKGYDRLLRICKSLHDQQYLFILWIVGDGLQHEIPDYVKSNDMQDYVTLWGNQDNPYPYMRCADWYICSSYAEGFSTTITEALIIGTPVISTDCSGTEELLGDSEYGIRCENSEEGLYAAMKRVLDNSELRAIYAEKALKKGCTFNKKELLINIESCL